MILKMPSLWPTLSARSWPTGATGSAEPGGSWEEGVEGLGGPGWEEEEEEEAGAEGAPPAVCMCVVYGTGCVARCSLLSVLRATTWGREGLEAEALGC